MPECRQARFDAVDPSAFSRWSSRPSCSPAPRAPAVGPAPRRARFRRPAGRRTRSSRRRATGRGRPSARSWGRRGGRSFARGTGSPTSEAARGSRPPSTSSTRSRWRARTGRSSSSARSDGRCPSRSCERTTAPGGSTPRPPPRRILDRRIGRNELTVIEVRRAGRDGPERDDAAADPLGTGRHEFAQRFLASTAGARDGLYWPTKLGEEESPLGPLVARARAEGYGGAAAREKPTPYHGVLLPDPDATGGARPGWPGELYRRRAHDRRLRPGGLSREAWPVRNHDVRRQSGGHRLSEEPRAEHGRDRARDGRVRPGPRGRPSISSPRQDRRPRRPRAGAAIRVSGARGSGCPSALADSPARRAPLICRRS